MFLTVSLSHPQEGLKAYQQVPLAAGLGKAYGENTSTPPKGRRAGVLMHPTSLPGPYGIGTIGAEAHAFVDWLATAGMQVITAGRCMASTTLHNGATDGANGGLEGLVMPYPFGWPPTAPAMQSCRPLSSLLWCTWRCVDAHAGV